jgi:hypothetical protein
MKINFLHICHKEQNYFIVSGLFNNRFHTYYIKQ